MKFSIEELGGIVLVGVVIVACIALFTAVLQPILETSTTAEVNKITSNITNP